MQLAASLDALQSYADRLPVDLCDACLGRSGARLERGLSNAERGRRLRGARPPVAPDACPLCEGITGRFDRYADLAFRAAEEYEFETFLVGSVYHSELLEREQAHYLGLAQEIPVPSAPAVEGGPTMPPFAWAEWLRSEVNREVGKRLEVRTGRRVDFHRPDLTFRLDTRFDHVGLQVASLFLQGRYRKLARGLPQTRWPCRFCSGLGCRRCDYRGKTYEESVEELIAAPLMGAAGASGHALHGMGREDVDARMLGTGRPFILELKRPKRRRLPWKEFEPRIAGESGARVEVLGLADCPAARVAEFKRAEPEKTYRARCRADAALEPDKLLRAALSFRGTTLGQRTPERVAHRRADLVRRRRILDVALVTQSGDRFELEIRADAGTYIKEFVSGDQGRTSPSLSGALGVGVVVEELDILDVAWK